MNSLQNKTYKIAVIGGGVSGIGAANVLQQLGHTVTVYERSNTIGGVWSASYPQVRLQNIASQYRFSNIPWPFPPDLHPTAEQIMRYLQHAVDQQKIDLRLAHTVTEMKDAYGAGWDVTTVNNGEAKVRFFDKVILAVGQYTQGKHRPRFEGEERFAGQIISEQDIEDFGRYKGKRVAVVGFGKSALDMAAMTAEQGAHVSHVFRKPRWLIPHHILGIHYSNLLFARQSTLMMTSWGHPTTGSRYLHNSLSGIVQRFWVLLAFILKRQALRAARPFGMEGEARLRRVLPEQGLLPDLRSATAMAPDVYYPFIAEGKIEPHHAELSSFIPDGIQLGDGTKIKADVVILALGSKTPTFPFLPPEYREITESEPDGLQLYRHLIHPALNNLAFAGYNHGFLHIPALEAGMLWVDAYFKGQMTVPTDDEMLESIAAIRDWKRENIAFEPSRSCAVNTRFQQYLDVVLQELTLAPYRKSPNFVAEFLAPYTVDDYATLIDEYKELPEGQQFSTLPVNT